MMDRLLADMPLASGDRISILVNSLGATPPEELSAQRRGIALQEQHLQARRMPGAELLHLPEEAR